MAAFFRFFCTLSIATFFVTVTTAAPTPTVLTRPAKPTDLFDLLSYPARIESKVNSTLYAQAEGGVVTRIIAPLGARVKRNQKLLVIKQIDPIYQYAPMTFTSPVDGIVSHVAVTEGSQVSKGEALISITNPDNLKVTIEVAAQDLQSIKTGLVGELKISGQDKSVPIKIKGVSPYVDPGTGTATAEIEILPQSKKDQVPPGQVGQALFQVNKHKAFVFPENAITYLSQGTFMRVVRGGKAYRVAVKLGQKQRGNVEILSGISENDEVVERSSGFVAEGEAVIIQKSEGEKKVE